MSGSPFDPVTLGAEVLAALAGAGDRALSSVWDTARWWMNTGAPTQDTRIWSVRASTRALLRS